MNLKAIAILAASVVAAAVPLGLALAAPPSLADISCGSVGVSVK